MRECGRQDQRGGLRQQQQIKQPAWRGPPQTCSARPPESRIKQKDRGCNVYDGQFRRDVVTEQ